MQFGATIVVARIAGAEVLGTVAYGIAFTSVFGFIADLGTGTAHIKLVSDKENQADCNKTFLLVKLALIALFALVILAYIFIKKQFFQFTFPSEIHRNVVFIAFAAAIVNHLISISSAIFRSKIEQAKQDIPNLTKTLINQLLRISVVILGFGAIAITISSLVAVCTVLPIYIFYTSKYPFGSFDKVLFKKYLGISLPLILVVASNSFIAFGEKLLLQRFTDSTELGFYIAGYRMSDFILLIATSIGLLFMPTFTEYINKNDFSNVNRLIHKFEQASYTLVLPIVLSLFFFSQSVISIFYGEEYVSSAKVLFIITLSLFIHTALIPYGNILSASHKFTTLAILSVFKALSFLILSYFLVSPNFAGLKSYGMSLSILGAQLCHSISLLLIVKIKYHKIKILSLYKIIIYAVVFNAILFLPLQYWFNIPLKPLVQLTILPIYFILFWVVGKIMEILPNQAFQILFDILKVRKLFEYVKSELKNKS